MKYSIEESVVQIQRRSASLRQKRERQAGAALVSMNLALCALLAGSFYWLAGNRRTGAAVKQYGASVVPAEAGGYVLVGVVCFVLAVIITIACVRYQKRHDR